MLTSTNNPKIKHVRALQERSRNRRKAGAFVVEGLRLVEEAFQSKWQTQTVFYTADLDERMVENAIMKTLGGKRKQLFQALWAEYICLGALSGLIAAFLATIIALVISHFVLKMPLHWNFSIWIYGMLGGALGVSVFGVLGSYAAIRQPPMKILKKISLTN